MERELKLRVAVEDLEKLRHVPLLAQLKSAADPANLLTSTYFATPELAFHWCKASLRVRAVGGERLETLKLEGSMHAGLFDRDEFEMPVRNDTPDLKLYRTKYHLIPIAAG